MANPDHKESPPGVHPKDSLIPGFREFPSVTSWTESVSILEDRKNELLEVLAKVSAEQQFTFGGFLTINNETLTYTFNRYPRQSRGIPSIEACENALSALTTNGLVKVPKATTLPHQEFRVLFGLREGYEEGNKMHTIEEVQDALPETTVIPVHIYVIGPWRRYEEPAVLITGEKEYLSDVYTLAESFHQERFTVEDLQQHIAYVVEPPSCTSPDPYPI